jgi:dihydrofolate reductase
MRTTIYMGMSLDGFVARADDRLDFLPAPPDGDEHGFSAFLATVDVIVMGRRTLEVVLSFGLKHWPYRQTPLIVLSRSLTLPPAGSPTTVSLRSGEPAALLHSLAAEGIEHVYVDGARTARAFLAEGLVDRLIVTHVPVLIGEGLSLWGRLPRDIRLTLLESRVQPGGLVQSVYACERES